MARSLDISEIVQQKAKQRDSPGLRWLEELPELVADLASEWDIAIGRPLEGGSESLVVEATTHDGADAVLRLQIPDDPSLDGRSPFEVTAWIYGAADGNAYARLLRADVERRALLLERLGPSLQHSGLRLHEQLEALCELLSRAWRVAPEIALESGAEKARSLASFIETTWEELRQPCSESAIARALYFASSCAESFDPATSVVVHGDAHVGNALRWQPPNVARQLSFKFVDPECFLAEPAYDLGVAMRDWSTELLGGDTAKDARDLCVTLARFSGQPLEPIWEWAFVERVSTGLFLLQLGEEQSGRRMLDVADLLALSRFYP